MSYTILFPFMRWPDDGAIERAQLSEGFEGIVVQRPEDVTEEQWRTCDAMVSVPDPLTEDEIAKLERCRIVVTPKVGFDNFDLAKWGRAGIPVCNVPDYGTMEVADHAIALMLALSKGIAFHNEALRRDLRGNWRPALSPFGRRLSTLKFGVVGLGRIGTATALRARAFGMDVGFFDPYLPNGADLAIGVRRYDTLLELFADSDIVSLHVPLSDETRNLIDAEVLGQARPGLLLINTARGELIDLDALHEAMRNGVVLAAGLDVLPQEPPDPQNALLAAWANGEEWIRDRLVLTPHSAFFTPESVYDMRAKGVHVAMRYLAEGRLQNCVNEAYLEHRR